MKRVRIVKAVKPPGIKEIIGGGNTSCVGIFDDGSILKYPYDSDVQGALDLERQILEAIGPHARIVRFLGTYEYDSAAYGLRFESAANGDLRRHLRTASGLTTTEMRQKWSIRCSQALAHIHLKGVIHSDIHPNNFLLDRNLDIKLCDFAGSLYGELDGKAVESIRFFLPRDPLQLPTVKTDLFALGSTLFEIQTDEEPYSSLTEEEVHELYRNGRFPDTQSVNEGHAITKCWTQKYTSANELIRDLVVSLDPSCAILPHA